MHVLTACFFMKISRFGSAKAGVKPAADSIRKSIADGG
jgi:hypothetical protein